MNKIDILKELELFNSKVDELGESSFFKTLTEADTGVTLKGERQPDGSFAMSTVLRGAAEESIKAFVLTIRFFIQDNESISLRNIANLYQQPEVDAKQRADFQTVRTQINAMLDSPNWMNLNFNGSNPTNREIFETYIYGKLAHLNAKKAKLCTQWEQSLAGAFFQASFQQILLNFYAGLMKVAEINDATIKLLKS